MASADSDNRWMYAQFPYNVTIGPLSTLVALYILGLGGNAIDVAYAIGLSVLVSIPAAILWGMVADRMARRKPLIIASYAGVGIFTLCMFFARNVGYVTVLYAMGSFMSAASGVTISIIVMEHAKEKKWGHNFALLQFISGMGSTAGLAVAFMVTGVANGIGGLLYLIVILSAASFASIFFALALLREPKRIEDRKSVLNNFHAFMARMRIYPLIFLRVPRVSSFAKVFAIFNDGKSKYLFAMYMAAVVFYFGTSVFNTQYPVGLKQAGLGESSVFAIILVGSIVQVLAFYYYDKIVNRKERKGLITYSLLARGCGYLLIGIAFLFFGRSIISGASFILYPLSAGLAYAIYYTVSNILLFEAVGGKKKGVTLGVYSSIVSIGSFGGAIASGYLSIAFGYGSVFIIAGALIAACVLIYSIMRRMEPKRKIEEGAMMASTHP